MFITNAQRDRVLRTEIFDWDEEYDNITDATDNVCVGTATADPQANLKEREMQLVLQQHSAKMLMKPTPGDFFCNHPPRDPGETLKTDNGSNLVRHEMEEFLDKLGVKLKKTAPRWPRANGEVERQNKSLLKAMRAAHAEGKPWQQE